MTLATHLVIRLTPGPLRPRVGDVRINEVRGGPETLLRWVETQLGLPAPPVHNASRIAEYASALDTVTDSAITTSMKTDRWATASELLSRRDELLMAGWDGEDVDGLPDIVRDLARAASGRVFAFPCEADRLRRVLEALNAGQVLPPHTCTLLDSRDGWPAAWQAVLARLQIVDPPQTLPQAPEGSALQATQRFLCTVDKRSVAQDTTFRYIQTRSESAAIEFVATILAQAPDTLPTTVLCIPDDDVALRLDACLRRAGLPTTGASSWSRAHPVLQVLPLTLALCWKPVDPQVLLDFLTLPVGPLPRRAAGRLAAVLAEEPGLGSGAWDEAVADLCSPEQDGDGKLRQRLEEWLGGERVVKGDTVPSQLVRSRCGHVARWASGRAALLAQDPAAPPKLIEALQIAAGQAALLGELSQGQGADLSEPQLARLLEEALAKGVEAVPFVEADGGPVRVRSLAEIDAPYGRLIWLGLAAEDATGCRWSTPQLGALRAAGVDVDDGNRKLSALRSAEVRGYSCAREAALAVLLPQDLDKRWHPLWLAIRCLLPLRDLESPPVLEDVIAGGDPEALTPFAFPCREDPVVPVQKQRVLWRIPHELLSDRTSVSATELQDRLACPLKWTLTYLAKLHPSPLARLPNDFQLKGTFCHSLLHRVFGGGGSLPSVDEAVTRILAAFDERLPLDAAPLAQPHRYLECRRLRRELEQATRVLIGTLSSGGYRIVGLEVEVSGVAFGKKLSGWIDCVAVRDNGDEAVIDFKYRGRNKFRTLIEEGKAVQLATYAYGRSLANGRFPAVAYLVLADGLLYTPAQGALQGDDQRSVAISAPAIRDVWQRFAEALERAGEWLTADVPVPARPQQEVAAWPPGATIVLEANLKKNQTQDVCTYCDYRRLCGMQETF